MEHTDCIIEKIRKLLRLAERAGTPEEAQTASARACQLLYKYKINRYEIGSVSEKREIAEVQVEHSFNPKTQNFGILLSEQIAKNFACECAFQKNYHKKRITPVFYGWREDAEIAKVVYENALAKIINLTRYKDPRGKEMFSFGFVEGMIKKFEEVRHNNENFSIVMKPPQEATDEINRIETQYFKGSVYSESNDDKQNYNSGMMEGFEFNPHSTIDGKQTVTLKVE